jgi:nucleoid-associated protein YgaU
MKYTLFKPDGTALRANVTLKFKENIDFKTKLKMAQMSSPDLTHVRTVKAGDTLPLMTYRIYGDSSWYPEVARFNNLRHFSAIKPGDEIHFPPLKPNRLSASMIRYCG